MIFTVLDFETTGLSTNTDIPVSCAFVSFENDFSHIVQSGDMLFYNEDKFSSAEAFSKHQITNEMLYEARNELPHNLRTLFKIMYRGILIGQNIVGFDYPLGKNYMMQSGYNIYEATQLIDTMKMFQPVFKKRMKLEKIAAELEITPDIMDIMYEEYFGKKPVGTWHGAAYDVTATALIASYGFRNGMFRIGE